ncbi:MAG TPA: DNA polymerase III subunit beta [Gammaproteobacteria bacterium]|nr:DNA polymerase III subunit beta [Gammaproteobacteria bacterium]
MKFTINRETLIKPLQMICGIVERRQTLPILSNVQVSVSGDKLTLVATDLEVQMSTHTEILDGSEGDTTIPARKFLDICRALPDEASIALSVDNSEKATIRSGKSRFTLSTLPAEDFPRIEAQQDAFRFDISQGTLKYAIDHTQFAMAQQDVRYYLNGLMMEMAGDTLRFVATDGHRLALCDIAMPEPGKIENNNENQQVIIPRKGVLELSRLLEEDDTPVQIAVGSNFIQLRTDRIEFVSKLIDGRFPDYQNVVPVNSDKRVVCDRDVLRQALARVSILSNEKFRGVRLEFSPGLLHVHAHNPEQEEAEEEVSIDYDGPNLEMGFNVNYMQDALTACETAQVQLMLSDPNSCCLIHGVDDQQCRYIIMPMRL